MGTIKLINGGIYDTPRGIVALIFIDRNTYAMLGINRSAIKGMSAPSFWFNANHKFQFTTEELTEDWGADKWVMLDGRLRIEKIDPEMAFVDYPNGELVPTEKYVIEAEAD